jgi:lipopolysaccharide export system protein LptA
MKRIAFLRRLLLLAALGFAVFLILSVRPQGTRPQLGTVDVAETLVKEIGAVRDRMRFRDFQFEEDRGDGEGFRLRASEAIGYRETGEDYFRLKDVVVEFRGKDPRAKGLVVGAPRAEFKQSTRAMKVFDGVFVERQGLSLSALSFRYDPTKKAFTSDGRVTVVQGRMIGLADKGMLESLNGSIVLDGAVQIGGHDAGGKPISVRAGNVTILKDGSLAATNGVTVKTGEILLRSQKADRGLVAGGESIRASGNVVFFLLPEETANRATLSRRKATASRSFVMPPGP